MIRVLAITLALLGSAEAKTLLPMTHMGVSGIGVASPGCGGSSCGGGGPPPSYTGPGDVVSGAQFWYGLRAYTAALASGGASTTKVVDVFGVTTTTTCTIFLKGDGTGGVDLSTAGAGGAGNQCPLGATTFCTVTNSGCSISRWYDQTGDGLDVTQVTAADQPTLTFSCIGSLPCATFLIASSQYLDNTAVSTSFAQPISFSMICDRTGSVTSFQSCMQTRNDGTNDYLIMQPANAANTMHLSTFAGGGFPSISATANDNAFHALEGVFNSSSSVLYVDGSGTSGSLGSDSNQETHIYIGNNNFNNFFSGNITEAGSWHLGFTPTQAGNLTTNQRSYWGF